MALEQELLGRFESRAEHLPNGGLLMSATAETFDIENPAHMAAARDIAAAIAPLNALPWAERARA